MPLIPAVGGRDRQISMSLSQPGLHSEHQNSQGCTVRPCLKNKVICQTWSQGKWNIKTEPTPKTEQTWAKEMAQWVAIKPDHLSWIPGTHSHVEGENQFPQVVLQYTYTDIQ